MRKLNYKAESNLEHAYYGSRVLYIHYQSGSSWRDRMVVGFTAIYVISAYHHWRCEFEPGSRRGVQQYVIKFVSTLRKVAGFLRVLRFPPPIKLTATI